MMNARNVLLYLHIVIAMVTLGPLILFDVIGPAAIRARNVGAVRFVHKSTSHIGPATLLIPILGLALVAEGGYELRDRWIIASLVVYTVMLVNGIAVLGRTFGQALERLEADGDTSAELSRLRAFGAVNIGLFLVILWLMVAKPGM